MLEYLVEHRQAGTDALTKVAKVSNPSNTAKELTEVDGGKLAPFLHRPGKSGKGQGYSTTIIDSRKK
jgi:hypothetical protein